MEQFFARILAWAEAEWAEMKRVPTTIAIAIAIAIIVSFLSARFLYSERVANVKTELRAVREQSSLTSRKLARKIHDG